MTLKLKMLICNDREIHLLMKELRYFIVISGHICRHGELGTVKCFRNCLICVLVVNQWLVQRDTVHPSARVVDVGNACDVTLGCCICLPCESLGY